MQRIEDHRLAFITALVPGRGWLLAGFFPDGSLVLWRYVRLTTTVVEFHVQRWSVEGELLSDQDFGDVGLGVGGLAPFTLEGLSSIWISEGCGAGCYRGACFDRARFEQIQPLTLPKETVAKPVAIPGSKQFLTVVGLRSSQMATVIDSAGKVDEQVKLPFMPNLLYPVVPDWFGLHQPSLSTDGEIAALGRSRIAWVLIDTDRDWGSEIVVLGRHPLGVITNLKTGKGGIGAIAVDHRGGVIRLVGFWKDRWHDMRWDESHSRKWTEAPK
jgi:hypothetical protein